MSEGLIVRGKLREYAGDLSVSKEFEEALEKEVESLVKKACARTKANNRRTIMARDL